MADNVKNLETLLDLTIECLIAKVRSGEADAATLNAARALLKDNGIQARGGKGSPLGVLASSLPSFVAEDELPH